MQEDQKEQVCDTSELQQYYPLSPDEISKRSYQNFEDEINKLKKINKNVVNNLSEKEQNFLGQIDTLEQNNTLIGQNVHHLYLINKIIQIAINIPSNNPISNISTQIQSLNFDELINQTTQLNEEFLKTLELLEIDFKSLFKEDQEEYKKAKEAFKDNQIYIKETSDLGDIKLIELGLQVKQGVYQLYYQDWPRRETLAKQLIQPLLTKQAEIQQIYNIAKASNSKQKKEIFQKQLTSIKQQIQFLKDKLTKLGTDTQCSQNQLVIPVGIENTLKPINKIEYPVTEQILTQAKMFSDLENELTEYQSAVQQIQQNDDIMQKLSQYQINKQISNYVNQLQNMKLNKNMMNDQLQQYFHIIDQLDESINNNDEDLACTVLCQLLEINDKEVEVDSNLNQLKVNQLNNNATQNLQIINSYQNFYDDIYNNQKQTNDQLSQKEITQFILNINQINDKISNINTNKSIQELQQYISNNYQELTFLNENQIINQKQFKISLSDKLGQLIECQQQQNNERKADQQQIIHGSQIQQFQDLFQMQNYGKIQKIFQVEKALWCPVCMAKLIKSCFDCGHFYCQNCANALTKKSNRNMKCFICQKQVKEPVRIMIQSLQDKQE